MVALFVAFMFVGLVLTDLGLHKWNAWQTMRTAERAQQDSVISRKPLWEVPEGVHLSDVHTWFRPDPMGGLEVGADPFITHAIGAVRRVVLPNVGDQVTAGQPLFQLERDGRSITIPCTVTGQVVAVNSRLQKQPTLLSSDPYGSGWVCRVTPTSVGAVKPNLRFGESAMLWLEGEFNRLREFLSVEIMSDIDLGVTSLDGGFPTAGCLRELDQAAWSSFEAEFLKLK
jgi:glycine cleavage system H protein